MANENEGGPERQERVRHPSEQHRRQFPKNVAMMLVLVAVCVMFYLVAIVRMGGG